MVRQKEWISNNTYGEFVCSDRLVYYFFTILVILHSSNLALQYLCLLGGVYTHMTMSICQCVLMHSVMLSHVICVLVCIMCDDCFFVLLQTLGCDQMGQINDLEAIVGMGVKSTISGLDAMISWKPTMHRNSSILPGMQPIERM